MGRSEAESEVNSLSVPSIVGILSLRHALKAEEVEAGNRGKRRRAAGQELPGIDRNRSGKEAEGARRTGWEVALELLRGEWR